MRRFLALTSLSLLLTALLVAAAPASAQPDQRARDLWATVNVCDTPSNPQKVGIRASMPGNGTRQRMYMRFTLEAQNASDLRWRHSGSSLWILAGSAELRNRQAGFTFVFRPREPTEVSVLFRGVVDFEWRDRRRIRGKLQTVVVRRARAGSTGGRNPFVADPPGFSVATCRLVPR